jgi:hypothetical protein
VQRWKALPQALKRRVMTQTSHKRATPDRSPWLNDWIDWWTWSGSNLSRLVVIPPPVRVLFLLIRATLAQILVWAICFVFPLIVSNVFLRGCLRGFLIPAANHGYGRSYRHCEHERGETPN